MLSLQNGVDNEDRIDAKLGAGRAMGGVAQVFATIESPGVIRHHAAGRIIFGELDGRIQEWIAEPLGQVQQLHAELTEAHDVAKAGGAELRGELLDALVASEEKALGAAVLSEAGDAAQRLALAILYRLRTGDAARVKMLHQGEEERQIGRRHPLLVQRENEIAPAGVDEKVRVLHALRDALICQQLSDIVTGEKGRKLLRHHIGVDGHRFSRTGLGRHMERIGAA